MITDKEDREARQDSEINFQAFKGYLRKLAGTNCIQIETGVVPPYYSCLGCIIEEAVACVSDMRQNKSGNVYPTCPLYANSVRLNPTECCPRIQYNRYNRLDLMYLGSAYPEAFRCLQRVGCQKSVVYTQLERECLSLCPPFKYTDQSGSNPACFADFNASYNDHTNKLPFSILCLTIMLFILHYR